MSYIHPRLDSQGFLIDFDKKWDLSNPSPFPYDFVLKLIRNEPYPLNALVLTISYWISWGMNHIHPKLGLQGFLVEVIWTERYPSKPRLLMFPYWIGNEISSPTHPGWDTWRWYAFSCLMAHVWTTWESRPTHIE